MDKKQKDTFIKQCYTYANSLIYTVCATTGESWLPKLCQFRWWRVRADMEDKHNIKIKETDTDAYKIYEDVMLEVLTNRINECKKAKSQEGKKQAKNKNVKRKA